MKLDVQDATATLAGEGQAGAFGNRFMLVRTGNAWYVAPLTNARDFAGNAREQSKRYSQAAKDLARLQSRIRKDQVDLDNLAQELPAFPTANSEQRIANRKARSGTESQGAVRWCHAFVCKSMSCCLNQ